MKNDKDKIGCMTIACSIAIGLMLVPIAPFVIAYLVMRDDDE